MARPREFDPREALNMVMMTFWQKGYQDTSIEDIVQATGVSRYGLYNTFGDKRDLFIKAMEHYAQTMIDGMVAPMELDTAGLAEIKRYFAMLSASLQTPEKAGAGPMGCLIGNASIELGAPDAALAAPIDNHFTRLRAAFFHALQNDQARGTLSAEIDPAVAADFLIGLVIGYLGMLRADMDRQAIAHFLEMGLATLT